MNEVVGKGRKGDERSDKKMRERDEVSALTHTTDTSRDVTVGVLSISIHLGNMKRQCGIANYRYAKHSTKGKHASNDAGIYSQDEAKRLTEGKKQDKSIKRGRKTLH